MVINQVSKVNPSTNRKRTRRKPARPTHIVGIGASAGGLSALEEFFDHMSSDSGMAFVIIQHLSPDFKSLMDDLLSRHTDMAIHRVTDGVCLEPNSIYLIPPKSQMTICKGKLFLTEVNKNGQQTELPIDVFFKSLAENSGKNAVAVILSGTGTDGSRGIKAIREADGLVLVQSIDSAQFDGMPRSAIATGYCDLMVPPKTMPGVILEAAGIDFQERRCILNRYLDSDPEGENNQIFAIIKSHYNLDFSKYKASTVGRRIQRRMDFHRINTLNEYIALLTSDVDELNALYHDLLIGVTEFFRDPKVFQVLENKVIPAIFESHAPDDDIRIWCAGCATGEEAYSIGILFAEQAREFNYKGNVTVFATDVHRTSLDLASQGRYERDRLKNVNEERLAEFFEPCGNDHYQVSQALRKMIVFAPHNLINDPPFTRMDLVSCRNLMIYLQSDIQEKVLSLFHFALKVNSYLFLGSSEGLGKIAGEFETIDKKSKIFRKLRDLNIAISMNLDSVPTRFSAPAVVPVSGQKTVSLDRQLVKDYDFLLKEYMPPGVLVDQARRILHHFGDASFFQQSREGRFENDILTMVTEALKVPLSTALHRVAKTRDQMTSRGLSLDVGGISQRYDLHVKYISHKNSEDGHFFISLEPTRETRRMDKKPPELSPEIEPEELPGHLQHRIMDLEQELLSTKESLQTSIEELQTTNEELQTTNEELMASNEELQSTNEELHSVNEELYTVNAEFENKNRELKELNQDHINLLNSLEAGIVYVDTDLKIRKFNPAVEKIFKLMPQDIGRPIDHIAYHLADQSRMLNSIRDVLKTGRQVEREVRTGDGQWLFKRVLPFRSADDEIKGVILMFTEITSVKEAEDKLKRHADELEKEVSKRTYKLQLAKTAADRANAAKSAFLANMSHEIRTPMSGVLMAAELLAEMDLTKRQADIVDTLQRGAQSLNTILDDILDFSKIEAGKVDMIKEPLILEETLDDVIGLYRPRISAKGLTVEVDIAAEVPEIIIGDQVRLKQILTNLVSNAIKFTHEGSIRLTVAIDKKTPRNCILHFVVSDTGIGVAAGDQEAIFEPFAQGDPSLTRKYGGTGLGLPISKRLVELMGGKLWLESASGETAFHFTCIFDLQQPRHKQPQPDSPKMPTTHDQARQSSGDHAACKILLVEDDNMNQDLISRMVQNIGCQLTLAGNGREAIKTLEQHPFDLVLMDISMPVMDGLTATRKIRKFPGEHINYEVPIVALTAHAMEEDIKKFVGAGMNQVLTKPLSTNTLRNVIIAHCDLSKA